MSRPAVRLHLLPLGRTVEAEQGSSLEDALFPLGFEFPCGGAGTCGGCRVRVTQGELAVTPAMREALTQTQLDSGWRLACQAKVTADATLEIEQWDTPVLFDDTPVPVEPRAARIIAIDLGTTTIAAQLIDAATGQVLAVETALNPQRAYGADLMTRVERALNGDGVLTRLIQDCVHDICSRLGSADEILLCGNTVMQHLFCGAPVESLSHVPFTPVLQGMQNSLHGCFLPNLGGFVGSDILAGIIATGIYESDELVALADLGTNGEIVVGTKDRLLCASAAAGPAFEAGRIRTGMRAAPGAIWRVRPEHDGFCCDVIGGTEPRGLCGSGLVDAVAAGLQTRRISPNGRLSGATMELAGPVTLAQSDVRELQLAKAAIAAGIRILTGAFGARPGDIRTFYLAGAFGNYVHPASARRIGLLEIEAERIVPAGNTALRGTRMIALTPSRREFYTRDLPLRIQHVPLASDAAFQDTFVDCLSMP